MNIFSGCYPLNHNMQTKMCAKNSKCFPSLQDYFISSSVFTIAPSLLSDLIGSSTFTQIHALLLAAHFCSVGILSPRTDCDPLTAGQTKMVPSHIFHPRDPSLVITLTRLFMTSLTSFVWCLAHLPLPIRQVSLLSVTS